MANELILEPKVFAPGQTQWNPDEFRDWMEWNNHSGHVGEDTPLGRLWADVSEDDHLERMIEFGGRHCYRAWDKGRGRADYIRNILDMEHGSVLEHSTINWAVQGVSRSLSLELARHRVGIALSQESQRFVDAGDIDFVVPPLVSFADEEGPSESNFLLDFLAKCRRDVEEYRFLQRALTTSMIINSSSDTKSLTMAKKRANEAARSYLPNACETRFLWSTNMRLLRHFLWLRGGSGADLEIRRLAVVLLEKAKVLAPAVFDDMGTILPDDACGVPVIVSAYNSIRTYG